jgi:hypothetical protein
MFGTSLDDPRTQGILALAAGLLDNRGRNFAGALSQGLLGGLEGFNRASVLQTGREREAVNRQLTQAQLDQIKRAQEQAQRDQQLMSQFALPQFPVGSTVMRPETMAQGPKPFDPRQFVAEGGSPQGAMTMAALQPRRPEPMKVGKDDRVVVDDGRGGMRELLGPVADGWETVGSTPAGQILQRNSRSGELRAVGSGPQVVNNVNTAKPFMNELAGGLGKQIESAAANARAAANSITTSSRLLEALDSPQGVIAGPGATFRIFGSQLGQMFGVSGKNAAEQLTNTRQAIQAMAQLELDAAQQMKGQGQITEAERDIIRRAAAGNIDTFTGPELRLLATTVDKVARSRIASHQSNVNALRQMPGAEALLPFMNVEMPPAYSPPRQNNVIDFSQLPPGR